MLRLDIREDSARLSFCFALLVFRLAPSEIKNTRSSSRCRRCLLSSWGSILSKQVSEYSDDLRVECAKRLPTNPSTHDLYSALIEQHGKTGAHVVV